MLCYRFHNSSRTDFYNIQKTKDDKIGFPPGIKEEILLSCMQKYENIVQNSLPASQIHDIVPPAIEEVEIETEDSCATASREVVNDIEMFDKSVPKKEARQTKRLVQFAENDYKNGALFEKYCWSQTLKDVELSVILPKEVKSGKHVKLNLKSNYLAIKSLLPIEEELVNGETWDKYRHNDVVWTISDGKLILSFGKFLMVRSVHLKSIYIFFR